MIKTILLLLPLAILIFGIAVASAADSIPPAAWQLDGELASKWKHLTGKYIFQVACVPCHNWGPEHLSRIQWERYLKDFPANHKPDVRDAIHKRVGPDEIIGALLKLQDSDRQDSRK